jgi:hypothetical protein
MQDNTAAHAASIEVEVKVTLRLTVSQSVSLGVEPHLGLMTRYILLFDNYGLAFVWRPLCLLYMLLTLVRAVFFGSESLGLATVFYSLRFETFLFVASYDSQGNGGGIRPRLHTGLRLSTNALCFISAWHTE